MTCRLIKTFGFFLDIKQEFILKILFTSLYHPDVFHVSLFGSDHINFQFDGSESN